MPSIARSGSGCLHSAEPFDTAFAALKRPDLTIADRVVHAAMVSLHRLGRLGSVTQEQIAAWAYVSRRTVIRACQALVRAGLLVVTRWGQGRPNGYALVGIDAQALAGRSDNAAAPAVTARRIHARARPSVEVKEKGGKNLPPHPRWGFSAIRYPGGP